MGASGSGTTTLGHRISEEFGLIHFDTDDFFWEPSNPPYQNVRELSSRQYLLNTTLANEDAWVLSGSLCGWGDLVIPFFDLVIFLWVPTDIRIARLKQRETKKFGTVSLSPGGDMYENHKKFIEWASDYDDGSINMRSKARHEQWLKHLDCKIHRYEGEKSIEYIIKNLTNTFTGAQSPIDSTGTVI